MTLWKPGIDLSNKAKPLQAGGPSRLPTTRWLVLTFLITGAWILPVRSALAEVQTITASHTYVMGDNDSRNDARQLCFLQAKRKVLEKAGSFIQSHSVVDNFNLTKDQITSYSAAVLSVETVKEDVGPSDGQTSLTCTVKAEVDVAQVKQLVAAIIADKGLQDRIAKQERQVRQLDEQVQSLNSRLSGAPVSSTGELRKERTVMLENIAELDRVAMVARERMSDERESIRQKTRIILQYVETGMTSDEVIKLLGQPFKKIRIVMENWYYGRLWICFDEPLRAGDYRVRWVVGDDMCLDTSARWAAMFELAHTDYRNGKYDLAVEGFEQIVKNAFGSPLQPSAYYWLGECYYQQKDYVRALKSFELSIPLSEGFARIMGKKRPEDGREWEVRAALFKSGLAAGEIGDLAKSKDYLKWVIEKFPTSDEAKLAKNKLAEIR